MQKIGIFFIIGLCFSVLPVHGWYQEGIHDYEQRQTIFIVSLSQKLDVSEEIVQNLISFLPDQVRQSQERICTQAVITVTEQCIQLLSRYIQRETLIHELVLSLPDTSSMFQKTLEDWLSVVSSCKDDDCLLDVRDVDEGNDIESLVYRNIETMRRLESVFPLTPIKEQNQAGFLTRPWTLKRPIRTESRVYTGIVTHPEMKGVQDIQDMQERYKTLQTLAFPHVYTFTPKTSEGLISLHQEREQYVSASFEKGMSQIDLFHNTQRQTTRDSMIRSHIQTIHQSHAHTLAYEVFSFPFEELESTKNLRCQSMRW